jgi:hypothetical protein
MSALRYPRASLTMGRAQGHRRLRAYGAMADALRASSRAKMRRRCVDASSPAFATIETRVAASTQRGNASTFGRTVSSSVLSRIDAAQTGNHRRRPNIDEGRWQPAFDAAIDSKQIFDVPGRNINGAGLFIPDRPLQHGWSASEFQPLLRS